MEERGINLWAGYPGLLSHSSFALGYYQLPLRGFYIVRSAAVLPNRWAAWAKAKISLPSQRFCELLPP
jgi:hypothetical protein